MKQRRNHKPDKARDRARGRNRGKAQDRGQGKGQGKAQGNGQDNSRDKAQDKKQTKKREEARDRKLASEFEFTIIAGSLKGRKITSPKLGITRPPLTRLRKSIFDFMNPYLVDARYLDLFSGTGSYLFEAVSRGAAMAMGVELNGQLVETINLQARTFKVDDRLFCKQADVLEILPSLAGTERPFDIVMIAPPQYKGWINRTLAVLGKLKLLNKDSLVVCQHDTSEEITFDSGIFALSQTRKYGNTTYSVLQPVR